MARTRPVLQRLTEAEKLERILPSERSRAVKQPGSGGRRGRSGVGGKTPAHLHHYTGTAPGGLGKSFYPRPDPPRRSKRRRQLLSLPPQLLRGPKPHNRVAHEIRHYQRTTHFLIPRAPFEEQCRYIFSKVTSSSRYWGDSHPKMGRQAIEALQTAAEYRLYRVLYLSRAATAQAKRKTCYPADIRLVLAMERGELPPDMIC